MLKEEQAPPGKVALKGNGNERATTQAQQESLNTSAPGSEILARLRDSRKDTRTELVKRGYSDELQILEGIYEVFGKVTIVPMKIWGPPDENGNFDSKGAPLLSGWPRLDYEQTMSLYHQELLCERISGRTNKRGLPGNLAVLLGKKSDDLGSVDLDRRELVEPFLAVNPRLKKTVRLNTFRGQQIFVRLSGEDYPLCVCAIKVDGESVGEFRGGNCLSIIFGCHPKGAAYEFAEGSDHMVVCEYSEIVWPDGWTVDDSERVAKKERKNRKPYALAGKPGSVATEALLDAIVSETEALCAALFPGAKIWGNELRLSDKTGKIPTNTKGSLTVSIRGDFAGMWRDWQTDESGSFIDLVQSAFDTTFLGAVKRIEEALGESFRVPKPVANGQSEMKHREMADAQSITVYPFVYHVFENKYYENKGSVWGPAGVDDIHRVLKVIFNVKDHDDRESIIVNIRSQAQIYLAANVAGCKAGVHEDKKSNPYLVLQNHKLVEPIKCDWSIIREMIESMFGPEQSPYVYAWLQWAYVSYESRTLAPGQLFVMVGDKNCGKTLFQEKVISPLLGSNTAKCQPYLMGKTEFNGDLIANCHWGLSDSISDMNWQQRKTLTEGCKNAIVNSEQRLRDLYDSPCVVDMCPRISCSINWASVEALPIFEEGMSDKMSLFKVEKSSRLPTAEMPRPEFEAEIAKALPGLAYHLKHEFVMDDATKETEGNVRFGVKTYHHPAILEKLVDVKRHVSLAEMLFKWQNLYEPVGSPLDIWSSLTQHDAESAQSVKALAPSVRVFGSIMTELVGATKTGFCHGLQVAKHRGHSGRCYKIEFDPSLPKPASANGSRLTAARLARLKHTAKRAGEK